jgi:hypothetical protein
VSGTNLIRCTFCSRYKNSETVVSRTSWSAHRGSKSHGQARIECEAIDAQAAELDRQTKAAYDARAADLLAPKLVPHIARPSMINPRLVQSQYDTDYQAEMDHLHDAEPQYLTLAEIAAIQKKNERSLQEEYERLYMLGVEEELGDCDDRDDTLPTMARLFQELGENLTI